jgi:ABC-type multidrug transport system fused ATPase/permease subunit
VVGQEPVLFDATIRENIRLGRPDASEADLEAACREANAWDFILRLPDQLDTMVRTHIVLSLCKDDILTQSKKSCSKG